MSDKKIEIIMDNWNYQFHWDGPGSWGTLSGSKQGKEFNISFRDVRWQGYRSEVALMAGDAEGFIFACVKEVKMQTSDSKMVVSIPKKFHRAVLEAIQRETGVIPNKIVSNCLLENDENFGPGHELWSDE